jgi:hypothetical protein
MSDRQSDPRQLNGARQVGRAMLRRYTIAASVAAAALAGGVAAIAASTPTHHASPTTPAVSQDPQSQVPANQNSSQDQGQGQDNYSDPYYSYGNDDGSGSGNVQPSQPAQSPQPSFAAPSSGTS